MRYIFFHEYNSMSLLFRQISSPGHLWRVQCLHHRDSCTSFTCSYEPTQCQRKFASRKALIQQRLPNGGERALPLNQTLHIHTWQGLQSLRANAFWDNDSGDDANEGAIAWWMIIAQSDDILISICNIKQDWWWVKNNTWFPKEAWEIMDILPAICLEKVFLLLGISECLPRGECQKQHYDHFPVSN